MAKNNNLQDFLTDVANSIRTKTGTTDPINAQDFSDKILNIPSGENTLKKLLDTTEDASNLFRGYQGTSVDDLIQYSDTENVTRMDSTFGYCYNLPTIPLLNTSKVTNIDSMFIYCSSLTAIPQLDTSNVTSMRSTFSRCEKLITIPQLNTSKVTNTESMFSGCNFTTVSLFDTSKVEKMNFMFSYCYKLTTIPQFNTSNVTDMTGMFVNCYVLTTVPALDVSNVTKMNMMFQECSKLKSVLMTNIGANLDIKASTQFEREDLLVILNNLKTVTSATTLTMGTTNLGKLTDEDKAIAINKG